MNKYKIYDGKTIKIMSCRTCNKACKFCYLNYQGDFDSTQLYNFVQNNKDKYEIKINGSEPLLREGFLKSFKLAGETMVLTNGLVFKDNLDLVDEIVASGIKKVSISFQYDLQEKISSVELDYVRTLFPKLRAKGLNVEAMCTITKYTYNKVIEICTEMVKAGANYAYLLEFMPMGSGKNMEDLSLSKEQRLEFFKQFAKAKTIFDKDTLYIYRGGNMGDDTYTGKKVNCPAGDNLAVITPDKKVYPCNLLIAPEYQMGYVDDDGKIMIDIQKQAELLSVKTDCLYKNIVKGC